MDGSSNFDRLNNRKALMNTLFDYCPMAYRDELDMAYRDELDMAYREKLSVLKS
jgi:hypothetical protein